VMDPEQVEPLPVSFVAAVTAIRAVGHGLGRCLPP